MATIADDTGTAPQTQADRIRERGGANLPPTALEIMHQHELKQRALRTNTKISEEFRREQLASLDAETDTALRADRDATLAAKKKPLEQARGRILAEIIGTTESKNLGETASESAERHHKAMRAELELQNDLTVATSADDPDVLADLLEETLLASNKIERARKLAPVIVARLAALSAAKTIGANDAWARAMAHTANSRSSIPQGRHGCRDVDARLAHVEPEVDRQYRQAARGVPIRSPCARDAFVVACGDRCRSLRTRKGV